MGCIRHELKPQFKHFEYLAQEFVLSKMCAGVEGKIGDSVSMRNIHLSIVVGVDLLDPI